ncbi:hypothetical protein OKW46_002650 [Paraburkholderia sp. WSM4179]|nr:hypothetical protein [Paraburkholderia sp. WSM4179]
MLTNLNGRLRVVVEVSILAILHSDLHLVGGIFAYGMFDNRYRQGRRQPHPLSSQNTAAPLANLIDQQPACHRTAYCAEPGGRLLRLDCVDRDTCIRVDGNGSWRLGGITVNIVVRVPGRWRRRTAMVVMNMGFAHRVGPRALLLRIRLSHVERHAGWLRGDRCSLRQRRRYRSGFRKQTGHCGDAGEICKQ